MEKTTGLKECPRCGLRNRRGAYQCDFCGWDFKAASDDWMGKVSDLEKIGREVEVADIDRSTRSKIELTMKKPAQMPAKERKPEKQLEMPPHLALEDHGEVVAQTSVETCPEEEVETAPAPEIEVSAPVVSPAAETMAEPAPPNMVEEITAEKSRPIRKTNLPLLTSWSLMGTGAVLYVMGILLTMSHLVGMVVGWGIAIVASALIALAVMRLLPQLKKKGREEEEIVLCPVCHEIVTEKDAKCPSCGVKFKETPLRE